MKLLTRSSLLCVFIAPLLITVAFLAVIFTERTIAPVDLYWAAPGYYEPGTPERVHNHYITDLTNVPLPLKYYLATYSPESCRMRLSARGISHEVSGFELPQGDCYPIGAIRAYLQLDTIFPLSRVFGFLTAYDLSHLLLLLALYFAAYFFFSESLKSLLGNVSLDQRRLLAAVGASLLTTSFPAARDLQFDTFETGLPLLLAAIAFVLKFARSPSGYGYLALGFAAFSGSFTRVNMQGLAQNSIFLALYLGVFHFPEVRAILRSRPKLIGFVMAGAAALAIGVAFHLGGILIFLNNTEQFVPDRNLSGLTILFRRLAAWLFSFGHFFGGEIAMSFKTFDPLKVLETLGGREYPSYDWASFFLSPVVSLYFALFLLQRKLSATQKSVMRLGLIMLALDLALVLLPTYRFIYLRLHSFLLAVTMTVLFLTLISDLKIKLANREIAKVVVPAAIGLFVCAALAQLIKPTILGVVQGKGTFGFDPAFWPLHFDNLIKLLTFQDQYTWLFFATALAGLVLLRARRVPELVALIVSSGLLLNTFHYAAPLKRELFYSFLEKFKTSSYEQDQARGRGLPTTPNINLLLNRPVTRLYESLEIKTGNK